MTSWQDIQKEIEEAQQKINQEPPQGSRASGFDVVRRAKYDLVKKITGRPLLVYATAFHNPIKAHIVAPLLTIDLSDKDGFYEIIRNIKSQEVDVFVHSPGGSAEAAESIVKMLRKKFKEGIYVVQPGASYLLSDGRTNPDDIIINCDATIVNKVRKEADDIIEDLYRDLKI